MAEIETPDDTSYVCNDCNTVFSESKDFYEHDCTFDKKSRKPRKNASTGFYKCDKCGKVFKEDYLHLYYYN